MAWDALLKCLIEHRLAGLFAARARDLLPIWPASLVTRLRSERMRSLLHGKAYADELGHVLSAFSSHGIPVIVLKGWALIHSLYAGDVSQRRFSDVDILVHPSDVDAGEALLKEIGYALPADEPHPGYHKRYACNLAFTSTRELAPVPGRVRIEMHWALLHVPYFRKNIDIEGLFARSAPLTISGVPGYELSPADTIIHLAAHQYIQHGAEECLARDYELLAWMNKHQDQLDWPLLVQRANSWRVGIALQQAVERLNALWPGHLSDDILRAVRSMEISRRDRWMYRIEAMHIDLLRVIEIFLSLPNARKLRYLWETAFPGRDFLQQRYGSPPLKIWPLLHVVRLKNALTRIPGIFRSSRHHNKMTDHA